jgi:hypothetical protein
MTPDELEQHRERALTATAAVQGESRMVQYHIFHMLCALLQHEADKERRRL